jgi:flagellar FliJ protein
MFKFKLQPLLDYRRIIEENAQQDFALRMRELEIAKQLLASIAGQRAVLARRFVDLSKGRSEMKADDLAALTSRLELLRIRQREQEKAVIEKDAEKESSRLVMLDAMRSRRIMELLRDRHFENYKMENKRRETRQLDEFGIRGYVHREAL